MSDAYINFDAEDFRELIADHGERVEWHHALPCPNCSAPQDNADPDSCPFNCVDGHIYVVEDLTTAPKDAYRVFIDGLNKMILHPQLGRVPSGTGNLMTMYDEIRFNDLDYFVLIEREEWITDVLTKGAGLSSDKLPHAPAVRVDQVALGAVAYATGTDWELDIEANAIHWLSENRPSDGAHYSVEYTFSPTVRVIGKARRLARNDENGNPLVLRAPVAYRHPSEAK